MFDLDQPEKQFVRRADHYIIIIILIVSLYYYQFALTVIKSQYMEGGRVISTQIFSVEDKDQYRKLLKQTVPRRDCKTFFI